MTPFLSASALGIVPVCVVLFHYCSGSVSFGCHTKMCRPHTKRDVWIFVNGFSVGGCQGLGRGRWGMGMASGFGLRLDTLGRLHAIYVRLLR